MKDLYYVGGNIIIAIIFIISTFIFFENLVPLSLIYLIVCLLNLIDLYRKEKKTLPKIK